MDTLREHAIAQIVLSRLNQDRRTYGQTIDVIVAGSEITLTGWCDSEEQKLTARMIANGTYGVRQVIDNVKVRRLSTSV